MPNPLAGLFDKGPTQEEDVVDNTEKTFEGPILLDLGQIRDEPVIKGWHLVEIERADAGSSSKKGLTKIFVLSRIIDEGDPDFNRTIIWSLMLEGDGLVFTKRCLNALEYPAQLLGGEGAAYATVEDLADSLVGKTVEVRVKHKMYQGNKQAEVNNWRAYTSEVFS